MKTMSVKSWFGMACFFLVISTQAQFECDLFSGNSGVRGAVIPIYLGKERQPSMVVRVSKIYRDYQTKGFFRIGVLPIGVMEGVTFEVRHVDSITNSLVQISRWLGPQASNRLEFRKVTIQIDGSSTNRLQAERIHVLSGGKWELVGDVRVQVGTNQTCAERAILQVVGGHAGNLVMASTPPWTTNLFAEPIFALSEHRTE